MTYRKELKISKERLIKNFNEIINNKEWGVMPYVDLRRGQMKNKKNTKQKNYKKV